MSSLVRTTFFITSRKLFVKTTQTYFLINYRKKLFLLLSECYFVQEHSIIALPGPFKKIYYENGEMQFLLLT